MSLPLHSAHLNPSALTGRRILVVGLGESGLAMARWLARQGVVVAVADTRAAPPGESVLSASVSQIDWRSRGVALTGGVIDTCLENIELIALSPGVAFDSELITAARQRGIPVWSEVDCFLLARRAACPQSKVLAITGANGKTTTTALTAHLLNSAGIDAVACGNISPSLLDAFMAREAAGRWPAAWVLELSSFQLEATQAMEGDAAIVLNLSADHLDRHYLMSNYAAAKARIYEGCAYPVWNRADPWAASYGLDQQVAASIGDAAPTKPGDFGIVDGAIVQAGASLRLPLASLPLLGRHNALNVQAALALAQRALPADKRIADLLPGVLSFKALAHRMALVATINGVRYVDDSKATNVGATLAAIDGLSSSSGKLALLLGGDGKRQDFLPLTAALARAARFVALIGKDAAVIAASVPPSITTPQFNDLPAATRWLAAQALPGDTVLLSPACASLDMFRNYIERAEVFAKTVRSLAQAPHGDAV